MKKIIVLLLVLIPQICAAATIYLDFSATGCTGRGAADTNYSPATRACGSGTDKVYAGNFPYEAARGLSDGDTLSIRAGEYYSDVTGKTGYMWMWGSLNVSASNVTIENYNNETVWIKGGASRATPANHPNNALLISGSGSNNLIEGLNIYGGTIFGGTNNTMQNCDLSGGFDHQAPFNTATPDAAWPNVIRFIASVNAHVTNCKLHDNVKPPAGGNNLNMALVMHERDVNTIVEHSEFYNPCAGNVMAKYQSGYNHYPFTAGTHVTYRYNLFRAGTNGGNGDMGLTIGYPSDGHPIQEDHFYQNVFIGTSAGFLASGGVNHSLYGVIYNNTFYNDYSPINNWMAASIYNVFNNISYTDQSGKWFGRFDNLKANNASYMNYNDFYARVTTPFRTDVHTSNTLADWQSYTAGLGGAFEANSITTDPGFINASGTFSQASDFKRTSYPQNGRGGVWPSVMGAYVTGNEIIGTTRPAPPKNSRIIY